MRLSSQLELFSALLDSVQSLYREMEEIRNKYEDQGEDVVFHYSRKRMMKWMNERGNIPI